MVFIRIKHIKGYPYLYLCKSVREGKKVRQIVLKYLGKFNDKRLTDNIIKEVFKRGEHKCRRCPSEEDLTIDHIIPLLKGGSNEVSNLQVLCNKCNIVKGNKT